MWTVNANGLAGTPLYRFSTKSAGSATWSVIRDYSQTKTLPWSMLQEGVYQVSVIGSGGGKRGQAVAQFQFVSRITAGSPVVSSTQNPLVALYSAPPCSAGVVSVSFWPTAGGSRQTTSGQSCQPGLSLNFYVGGMQANTSYTLQQQTVNGGPPSLGAPLAFQTGAVSNRLPSYSVIDPVNSQTSTTDDIMLMSFKALHDTPPFYPPAAFDLLGRVLWYYLNPEAPKSPQDGYLLRPVAGGTYLLFEGSNNALREVDLAGNLVRETNKVPINQQLTSLGQDNIACLSHEALRLPNGHTLTIGSVEKLLTNIQGPGTVDVMGNMVIDLDQNMQVAWTWNAFNSLDTSRKAVLGETYSGECPLSLAAKANDWTHANSVLPTADGNLLVSLRDQDWVVKVDYENGTGDGHLIWALGNEGNFNIVSTDPWPWFSHQHDIEFDGTNYEVFDNGNTRVSPPPLGLGSGNSRGYVFSLDETTMTVTVVLAADLNSYSPSFGSAQLLANGNYAFLSGDIGGTSTQTMELLPNGTPNFGFLWQTPSYRWFRMPDLYTYKQ